MNNELLELERQENVILLFENPYISFYQNRSFERQRLGAREC